MKYLFILLLVISSLSYGKLIEIDHLQKTIYTHPTPVLEMTIVEVDRNSGVLYLTADYVSPKTVQELDNLKLEYPGYEIKVIYGEKKGLATFKVDQIIKVEIPMMQGQIGPLVHTAIELNGSQLKTFKTKIKQLPELVEMELPVVFRYVKNQVIESYSVKSDFCSTIKAETVKDMILSFSNLRKPLTVKYDQTFLSFKEQLLQNCFQVSLDPIQSFKDFLSLKVQDSVQLGTITGLYSKKVEAEVNQSLKPVTVINLN